MRKKWTDEEVDYLIKAYPDTPSIAVAEHLGMRLPRVYAKANSLGLHKSEAYLKSSASGRLRDSSFNQATRFKPGHQAWNKGTKGLQLGGSETQFKKGAKPLNHKPVGSTRVCSKNGYILIKVAEGIFQWPALHRELWKQHHGEYPAKGMVLIFKDGNPQNCVIENLQLITRKQNMQRNTIMRFPKEVQEVVRLNAKLRRKINEQ